MNDPDLSRRALLKTTGAGILGATALSAVDPASGHESYEADVPDRISPTLVRPRPEEGFNYPYYLYAPEPLVDDPRPLLVEPNNSGKVTDDYREHLTSATSRIENGIGRTLSEATRIPLLFPVFPRSMTDPVDGTTYTHALDVETLEVTTGEAARIDLQLLAMVEHARGLLAEMDYPIGEGIHMTGFSASGNFVNRFPALHPTEVEAVTAGAINGTAILPIAEDKGHTLNYHIGVADLESLTGEPFDLESYRGVEQYIYMGSEDTNDTIPYSDAWGERQREIALDVYGEDMQDERMPYCESVYDSVGASAQFEIYDGVGHRTTPEIMADLVRFHRSNVGISRVQFGTAPTRGDEGVALEASVADGSAESFDLRVFGEDGSDLTESPGTVGANESVDAHIDITRRLKAGEAVTAVILPPGTTDRDRALAKTQTTVIDTAHVAFVDRPSAGGTDITLEYAVDGEYTTGSPIHIYVTLDSGRRVMVGTIPPGTSTTATYTIDSGTAEVPFVAGDTVSVALTDIETDEEIASAETSVRDGGNAGDPANVAFTRHPTYDDTEVHIEYALDERYEVTEFAGLYLQTGDNAPMLLDQIEPGESATESYPINKYPFTAADNVVISLADGETLARDDAVVLVRASGEDPSDSPAGEIAGSFTVRSDEPTAGRPVPFDATASSSPNGDLLSYEWFFGGDGTRAGETVEYTFENGGTYNVHLELVDDAGASTTVERQIEVHPRTVNESPEPDVTPAQTAPPTDRDSPESTAGDAGPGFGVLSGLSGLAGAGYLLERHSGDGERTDD